MADTIKVTNNYLRDILDQPLALVNSLEAWKGNLDLHEVKHLFASERYKRVILTGMGSSYYALYPLYLKMIQHCISVYWIETSELIHYGPELFQRDNLLIAVSQSGESAEIISLLDKNRGKATLIGVTNSPKSSLALRGDYCHITHAGVEATVSCKTYLTALASLSILGEYILNGSVDDVFDDLALGVSAVKKYLEKWQDHIEQLKNELTGIRNIVFTGRGASLAAVYTAGLIIKESAHFISEGMSSASFRHGPFEMVSPNMFVMVYSGNLLTSSLNERLVFDIAANGGKARLIFEGDTSNPFIIPEVPEVSLPLVEILPAQLVSIALAHLHGHEPGLFSLASKVTQNE